ncbi:lipopolysaccharide biosynthesis protein [Enterovibrio norvegicus]|uniref:lipopolysaccharide biosynthesis protein n=1 Tax=Enterovibrio norvegicus TaxID=188144 RepID=UPI00389AEED2
MSRLNKILKNTKYNFVLMSFSIIIGFLSRKVFIDNLGPEFVGFVSSALSIIVFISFLELGLQQAILTSLYKPINQENKSEIEDLMIFLRLSYKYVATLVFVIATICALTFHEKIISNDIPKGYVLVIFYSLLVTTILDFLVNYKQVLFIADQKQYKVIRYTQGLTIANLLVQTILVYVYQSYWSWVIPQVLFPFVKSYLVTKITKSEYSDIRIHKDISFLYILKKSRKEIKKIKRLSLHRLSGVVTENSDNLLYLYFVGAAGVASIGNYKILFSQIVVLLNTINNSVAPSVGNVIASGKKENILRTFWVLYATRSLIASVVVLCFLILTQPFVFWWLGQSYVLEIETLILLILNISLVIHRFTINEYILGFSLFDDIKSPLIEIAIFLASTILLGDIFGVNGVLLGVIITNFCIGFCWKPFYLVKKGLEVTYLYFIKRSLPIFCVHIALVFSYVEFFYRYDNKSITLAIIDSISYVPFYFIFGSMLLALIDIDFRMFWINRISRSNKVPRL